MFAVAVLAAVLKIGAPDADPLYLRELPAEPLAKQITDRLIPREDPTQASDEAVEKAFGEAPSPEAVIEEMPFPEGIAGQTQEDISEGTSEVVPELDARVPGAGEDGSGPAEGPVQNVEQTPRAIGAAASVGPARATSGDSEAPVFYRPSLQVSDGGSSAGATAGTSAEPVCGDLGSFPASSRAVFPLPEAYFNSYDDTWGAPRVQGGHEGTDLMSPTGTPLFAITDGTIVPVSGANANGWNTLGGYTVMLRADYDVGPVREGDLFYYAHMDRQGALPIGTKVRAGQQVGVVGDTGQGPEVTRGQFPPHLHLGWYDTSGARTDLPSGAMNPYPLAKWLEGNGGAVRGGTDASYCEAPQGAAPVPSTGEPSWPVGGSPGQSPDLNTGEPTDARPSPIVEETEHNQTGPDRDRPEPAKETNAPEGEPTPPTDAKPDGRPEDPPAAPEPALPGPTVPDAAPETPQPGSPAVPGLPGGATTPPLPDADEITGSAEEIVEEPDGAAAGPRPETPQPGTAPAAGGGAGQGPEAAGGEQPGADRPRPVPDAGSLADRIREQVDSLLGGAGIGAPPETPPVPSTPTVAVPENSPDDGPEDAKPKKKKGKKDKDDRKRDEKRKKGDRQKDRPDRGAEEPAPSGEPAPRPQEAEPVPEPPAAEGQYVPEAADPTDGEPAPEGPADAEPPAPPEEPPPAEGQYAPEADGTSDTGTDRGT